MVRLFGVHRDADVLHRPAQDRAGSVVELRVHQGRGGVHDVDGQAPVLQAAGGFQAEQTTTDDDGLRLSRRVVDHRGAVVEAAEPEHPRRQGLVVGPHAVHGWKERAAAGGDDEPVVAHRRAVVGLHDASEPVDPNHPDTGAQVDVVVGVPVDRIEIDLVGVVGAGQHVGEQDAVVVAVGLVTEDGDVEQVSRRCGSGFPRQRATPAMPLPITTSRAFVAGRWPLCVAEGSRRVVISNVLPLAATSRFRPNRGRRSPCR